MICKLTGPGKSFGTITQYCLRDARQGVDARDPRHGRRVAWTETLNLPTDDPRRAARIMGGTAVDAAALKRLSGGSAAGRKLEKPVLHYSLSWPPGQQPTRDQMMAAVRGSMQALGVEDRQALVVAHGDRDHPHVHVIANRVDWQTGRAAGLSRSRLKLSRWAEGWEREHGGIVCERRVRHNAMRDMAAGVARGGREQSRARWERERKTGSQPGAVEREMDRFDPGLAPEHHVPHMERAVRTAGEQARRWASHEMAELEAQHARAWARLLRRQREQARELQARAERAREALERASRAAGPRVFAAAAEAARQGHEREWGRRAAALSARHERERAALERRSRGLTGLLRRWSGIQRRAEASLARQQAGQMAGHTRDRRAAHLGLQRRIERSRSRAAKAPLQREKVVRALESQVREMQGEHRQQRARLGLEQGQQWQDRRLSVEARAVERYWALAHPLLRHAQETADRERDGLERIRRHFDVSPQRDPGRSRDRGGGWSR